MSKGRDHGLGVPELKLITTTHTHIYLHAYIYTAAFDRVISNLKSKTLRMYVFSKVIHKGRREVCWSNNDREMGEKEKVWQF